MNIKDIRREYMKDGLKRCQLHADPIKQFEQWLTVAMETSISDPTAMSVATVAEDGMPSLRTVLFFIPT